MALRDYLVNLVIGKLEEQGLAREPKFFDQFSDDELEQAHTLLCEEAGDNPIIPEPRDNGVGQADLDEIIAEATAGRRRGATFVPNWLIEHDLSDGAVRLYLYMLSHRLGNGPAFFSRSQEDMATAMGCTSRTIRRRLVELEKADLITPIFINTDPDQKHANRYRLHEFIPTKRKTEMS